MVYFKGIFHDIVGNFVRLSRHRLLFVAHHALHEAHFLQVILDNLMTDLRNLRDFGFDVLVELVLNLGIFEAFSLHGVPVCFGFLLLVMVNTMINLAHIERTQSHAISFLH